MFASLPTPRGSSSAALIDAWRAGRGPSATPVQPLDPLTDDDLHLALWCCYQLHHGGFSDLDVDLEWDPATIAFRTQLESWFEAALRDEHRASMLPDDAATALRVISAWGGPSLSGYLATEGTRRQLEEFVIHRSAYQLKEADGHTWAIPRLGGPGRAAMIEIQADEYGQGVPGEAHAELFAKAMDELGLDSAFGSYIDVLPGVTLATDNLVSLFGLNGRLRGALLGHLAIFEMCSVEPMTRYLQVARRLGDAPALARFYEVHVDADAHHGHLALDAMVVPFVEAHPELAADVIFGAAALSRAEARFARHLLDSWPDGSSLRTTPVAQQAA